MPLLLPFLGSFLLSALCQIPQGWKQADNCTTTTRLEGRPYSKPYYDKGNPSTIIDHQYIPIRSVNSINLKAHQKF